MQGGEGFFGYANVLLMYANDGKRNLLSSILTIGLSCSLWRGARIN